MDKTTPTKKSSVWTEEDIITISLLQQLAF